jgi:CubicO group peptidase (beta-lactamase class C family)
MERKLVAIMAGDVVGYGRLMEQDEVNTFARLIAMRFAKLLLIAWVIGGAGSQFPAISWAEATISCGVPLEADGEWLTGSPEEAGLNAALLCSLNEALERSPEMNVHAVVVVRDGKLVYETYRAGEDQRWGRKIGQTSYTPQMQHDVRSISKSVVSLLFGIALDRGLIASIDAPVFTYFPEYAALRTPEKDRIHLRHLLTMTSGLAWDEWRSYSDPENSEIMMIHSTEPYRFALEQPVLHEPGEEWNYSGGSTQLLAGVLQRTTGKPLVEFAREALFGPLQITEFEWISMMASGEVAAASGLRLRPRDMAKIGELVLEKGMWHGRRIVSEAWIKESTQAQTHHYGYHWWAGEMDVGERHIAWVAALGLGGQRIFIVPTYKLVVVITAGLYADENERQIVYGILYNYVLAAIRE